MKTKLVEIILKHMTIYFEPNDDFGPIALGAAEEILRTMDRPAEPETSISIGDTIQCVEDQWQGRVTGFEKIDVCTMLVCHSVVRDTIDANDRRLFDPRDVRRVMFEAKLTQFMRPSGRAYAVKTDLPIEVEPLYQDMLAKGCKLNAEVLRTGEVSITISNPEKEQDHGFSVTPNGPEVRAGIIELLKSKCWENPTADTLTCDLCGKVDPEADAIDSGWIPSYWKGETEINEPVCSECVKTRIRPRWGEAVLIEETITTMHEEPAQPGTLKEFVERLRALTEEHDRLEQERAMEHDDRPSLRCDVQIGQRKNEIYEEAFRIAQGIVNLHPVE